MDIIYKPLETRLIKDAKAVGAKVMYGAEMLVYQGAASFEIWCGNPAPVEVMREALLKTPKRWELLTDWSSKGNKPWSSRNNKRDRHWKRCNLRSRPLDKG